MTDHVFYLWGCPVCDLRWWTADGEHKRSHGCQHHEHVVVEIAWFSQHDMPKAVVS